MSHAVLLFLALFAGAALAQSAVEVNKAKAAAYKHDGYDPEYHDADSEYYGQDHDDHHHGSKHGKHNKSHSKPYKLTINLVIDNYTFDAEGGIDAFKMDPIGKNGVFRFDLLETAGGPKIGNGIVTGTFYANDFSNSMKPVFFANEVVTIEIHEHDFAGSQLTALGRLAWQVDGPAAGRILDINDTVVVAGGSGALNGASGTIQLVGGTAGATAILRLTVPKHYADHTGY